MVNITIDGQLFSVDGDQTILQVCRENNIDIPYPQQVITLKK